MIQNGMIKSVCLNSQPNCPVLKEGFSRLISAVTHIQKKSIETQRDIQKKVLELNQKLLRYRHKMFDRLRMENFVENMQNLFQKQSNHKFF